MRIAIDARAASNPQAGGFKAYVESIIRHVPRYDTSHQYTLYVDRPLVADVTAPNIAVRVVPARVPAVGVIVREQWALPRQWARDGIDVAHCPKGTAPLNAPCPVVLTLHDTILWDYPPEWRSAAPRAIVKRLGMHYYESTAAALGVKRARRVVTVSNCSKRDILKRFAPGVSNVTVVYQPPSPVYRLLPPDQVSAVRATYGLSQPFVLGMCSALPHKNTRGLVEAYLRLPAALHSEFQLVLVRTHALLYKEIASLIETSGLAERIVFLDRVADQDLCRLYNAASLFVFPSLYEGFGLPPVEAMACGAPVVASNTSSLPEVLGDAALLVDPRDCAALADAVARVLTDASLRDRLSRCGPARAARYSGERFARELLAVYAAACVGPDKTQARGGQRATHA